MKKRITMLLVAIGVLLAIMLPSYADVISETSVPVESEIPKDVQPVLAN